jgi:hypothetical protein
LTLVSGLSVAQDQGEGKTNEFIKQQKEQLNAIQVDMQKSYKSLVDEVTTVPQKVEDSGCLDGLLSIDTSIFVIDPASIWTALYAGLKDQLLNRVCNAAEEYANEATALLEFKLEAPLGIGSIGISQGNRVRDWDNLIDDSRVVLTNEEAADIVNNEVYNGDTLSVPRSKAWTGNDISLQGVETRQESRIREKEQKESLKGLLNIKNIWADKKKDEGAGDGK